MKKKRLGRQRKEKNNLKIIESKKCYEEMIKEKKGYERKKVVQKKRL